MVLTWILVSFAVGLVIPFQGIITSSLATKLDHPYGSALINFIGGAVVFAIAIMCTSATFPGIKKMTTIPWYLYTGGIIGAFFIFGAVFALPKIGSTAFFGLIVFGQLLMTAVVDHYGLLGIPVHKIDIWRVAGVILLLAGCWLIIKK